MDLTKRKCGPCASGVPKFTQETAENYLKQIDGWTLDGDKIRKTFHFKGFREAIAFVNAMADVAEEEGHHPNFCVNFKDIDVSLWTHAIGGLSENDFILAAHLDQLITTN